MDEALDAKILFGNIIHLIDPEIRKIHKKVCMGTKILHSFLVHDLSISETDDMTLNLNFNVK